MKKLMIAAAIVCATVATQAASVSWAASNVYAGNADDKATGVAYLMLASTKSTTDFAKLTQMADIKTALEGAIFGGYTPAAGSAGLYSHEAVANATLGLQDSKSYGNAYLVIFNGATVDDSTAFFISGEKALETLEGDNVAELKFNSQATRSKVATNWNTIAAVPEPTSGLLLLLGVAGLALRRRRA